MNKKLKIYYTSDTHGYLFPTDYVEKKEKNMGVLACIKEFEKDGNSLILDGGDTIQGSPFSKYMWKHTIYGCAIAEVFNQGQYDYITLGNHDFNNGYEGLERYLSTMKAECLVANVTDCEEKLKISPYVIHTLENGLKVGIVGVVTDYVNLWERPEHLENLKIGDTFEAAQSAFEAIKGKCDLTICLYHGGFECDLETGKRLDRGKENVGYRICKELGFDLLLSAHQHMPVEGRWLYGTYTLQLPANAQKYAFIEMTVKEDGKIEIVSQNRTPKLKTEWDIAPNLISMQGAVEAWLDQTVGEFSQEIPASDKLDLALKGSQLADFCNKVQLEYTGADFSCTSLGNNPIGFKKEVTTRNIIAAYQFPNTIKVLEVDYHILRKALERCAQYYNLKDGKIIISDRFLKPKVEHYNYDFFSGFEYILDISKPLGERVVSITKNGQPLSDKKYTLAMSDYRATGTGGYEFYKECPLVKEYGVDIQELVIQYIETQKYIEIKSEHHFEITGGSQ